MALEIPRIDDRTFDQLADALRRQLPTETWTDHNASDPGIMLLELLAAMGEMLLYRMDRVAPAHRERFLDRLIEPPQPVRVIVRFEARFTGTATSQAIPAGTRVATDVADGRRFVFETYRDLTLARPSAPAEPVAVAFAPARAILEVFAESLGVSDGSADQLFALRPPRQALGLLDEEAPAPILTDYVHRTAAYDPNPVLDVGGDRTWSAVPSLRTEVGRVGPGPGKCFAVDASASSIRFGDGRFGAIPPAGAVITAVRYAVLDGPPVRPSETPGRHALTVRRDEVRHAIDLALAPGVTLALGNTDAEGGGGFHPRSERVARGLRESRAPFRLVTAADFREAILRKFNAFQDLSQHAPRVLRISTVFDRRPLDPSGAATELIDAPGHVTLILLAGDAQALDGLLRDEGVALAAKQAAIATPESLWERLRRFLEPRRLITTRLARLTPRLRAVTLTLTVAAAPDRGLAELGARLRSALHDFLSPIDGGHGAGWPLGQGVFRSQLFRLVEDHEGVDHVVQLDLGPADADGNVVLDAHELPLLQALTVTMVRG